MRTDLISFILSSEKRKKIVREILEYPKRQWSCSFLEEKTKLPHATVYRTLEGLKELKLLKTFKLNKKDVVYEVIENNSMLKEIMNLLNFEQNNAKKIAKEFANEIKKYNPISIILYGSSVTGEIRSKSDIDILVIVKEHNKDEEKKIYDAATELSLRMNKTISGMILSLKEIKKEDNFIKSVKENKEVLYGKDPF
ncbi:nucleotidyltransferase domain-containing protein [Candidatus Woesearchaeota archaeon]|nr:nucleotidyltransferase domain-containing protein [Candidatus Woesearchaeota archaeon]